MSTITKEQAKDLRNAFQCWQQDYDPVEDKEQYDMFGLGIVAMDALLASLEAEAVAWTWFYYKQWNVTNDPERAKDVADGGVEVFPLYRRDAMPQGSDGNSPVIQDGWVMVPRMLTPRMITKLQQNTEIGSYIAANWAGAYDLFQKFWDEAIAAAPQQE